MKNKIEDLEIKITKLESYINNEKIRINSNNGNIYSELEEEFKELSIMEDMLSVLYEKSEVVEWKH